MKRLKYAVILLLGLSMATMMTSCSKEKSYQNRIVGKWQQTEDKYSIYNSTGTLVCPPVITNYDEEDGEIIEFYPDNVYDSDSGGMKHYKIEGDNITLWAGEKYEYTIQELTNATMVWVNEGELSDGGRYVWERVFKKLN